MSKNDIKHPVHSYCGLDLSLTSTGFCSLTGDKVIVETIKSKPKDFKDDIERLDFIMKEIGKRVGSDYSLIAIEDYFMPYRRHQIGAAIKLVSLQSLVRHRIWADGLPFVIVSPGQIKKFATGNGRSDKSLVVREVYRRWGVEADDDNQADACVLSRLARALWLEKIGEEQELLKFQRDVVEKALKDSQFYGLDHTK